jgi:NitT/TauT family transport system substrate-binding protein
MKRGLIFALIVFLTLTACTPEEHDELEKLVLPMGYVANVQFSPFYAAVEQGYFEEAGYDVSFDYRWETDGLRLVAAGELPFTIASGDQVIQARAQGLPVVAVASWYRRFPVAVMTLADVPLEGPEDLAGLSIGVPETFGASYIGLRALLDAGDLTEGDVDLQVIGYTQVAALTAETVDAVVVYANNAPAILDLEGVPYNILYVADHAELVSNAIVTDETMIEESPEEVGAFVDAFLEGVRFVLENPDRAFEISHDYIEGLEENAEAQRAVLDLTLDYWEPTESPLGTFNHEAWAGAQEQMLDAGLIEGTVPVDSLYTEEFVE